jgi:crossover junction endodeoxyribonuclease RusA
MLHLVLPEPPSANRWWRKWKNRMVLSDEARAYKEGVWAHVLTRRRFPRRQPLWAGPVEVTLDWYRSRKAGDLDKRIGVALDALQGVVYVNDNQIVRLVANRYDDKQNPRLEVTITTLTPAA